MALTISSNAEMVGSLFSSMSSGSRSLFASTDLLGISYMDYSSIKSGSYFKLLDAYYSLDNDSSIKSGTDKDATTTKKNDLYSTSTATDSESKLADIEDKAEKMGTVAEPLLTVGTKSLFRETTKTDEEGNTTTGYDTDKIYQAVKTFADQYNALIDSASDSKVKQISNAATSMLNLTAQNEKLLSSIGITIDEETNAMKVDEEAFKKADMNTAKLLFNGTASYAYQVAVKASMIDYQAQHEATKANTYTNAGNYSYNYSAGSILDNLI